MFSLYAPRYDKVSMLIKIYIRNIEKYLIFVFVLLSYNILNYSHFKGSYDLIEENLYLFII